MSRRYFVFELADKLFSRTAESFFVENAQCTLAHGPDAERRRGHSVPLFLSCSDMTTEVSGDPRSRH